MKGMLSDGVRNALSPEFRGSAKRLFRRLSSTMLGRPLELSEFRFIVENKLGIRRDSTVLVHCSFGRLKANFSASDAVAMLKEVVGEGGNILMPCYPGNGEEWLASQEIFDVRRTPIATGILAQEFSRSPDVRTSTHPIKAVAAWGKDRDFFIAEHHLSRTPYDGNSPYAKLLSIENSLVVGLATAKMAFYHCCEDSIRHYAEHLYTSEPVPGLCRTADGDVVQVLTHVHRTEVLRRMPSSIEFLTRTKCPGYAVLSYRRRRFYVGDVRCIYQHVREKLLSASTSATS